MIVATTYASTACLLIAAEPVGSVSWTLQRPASWHASKTRVEERTSTGATLRNRLAFTVSYLDSVSATAFFTALKDPNNKPVLCPLWPAATQWQAAQTATSGLRITWEPDFTTWQIHTGSAPVAWTPTALARSAPLLWGRFDKSFEGAELDTSELFDAKLTFLENGPASYAVTPVATIPTGPTVNGETPLLLSHDQDYEKAKANGIDVDIARSRIGYTREEVETYHTQAPRRTVQSQLAGDIADMMRLAATFHQCGGAVKALWFPSGYAPARLTANPTGIAYLTVDNAANLGAHPYIVIRNGQTGVDHPHLIDSISGNALYTHAVVPAMDYRACSLQLLYLGRFKGEELTINCAPFSSFSAKVDLVELPPDYSAIAGETYGTSYGAVHATAHLFELTDSVGTVYRWTNYESAISYGGNTYSVQRIAWDKITTRLNLDDGTCKLTCDSWEGNPLMRLLIPRRGQQFTVTLKELDLVSGVATTLWAGTARSARSSGRVLSVPLVGLGRIFEQRIPRRVMGPSCPYIVYDDQCGMTPASKAKAGTLVSQVSTYVIRVQLSVAHAAHFFAGGWMTRTNPNGGAPTWAILDSTLSSANQVDITVDAPLSPALVASEAVTLYPGCDCSFAACTAHGNTAKFGGFPSMPSANPAFVAIKDGAGQGGKK